MSHELGNAFIEMSNSVLSIQDLMKNVQIGDNPG